MRHIGFLFLVLTCNTCLAQPLVKDIVLINVGNTNYKKTAKELSIINSLNPKVIAIDIAFTTQRNQKHNQILVEALWKCQNLVMATKVYSTGENQVSHCTPKQLKVLSLPCKDWLCK